MTQSPEKLPSGNNKAPSVIVQSSVALGAIVRDRHKQLALKQLDLAGLANTGNCFIVDVENGKPTVQLQKVLDLLQLLRLEVVVRA